MHLVVNALPIRPGGGLTVLCGLVRSLHECRPSWRISVLTGCDATEQAIKLLGVTSVVLRPYEKKTSAGAFVWQFRRLGPMLRKLEASVLVGFNHFQWNVPCPQVVYHLNLRRFCRDYRSRRPSDVVQEQLRDWLARKALRHADANVFESAFLRKAAQVCLGRAPRNSSVVYIGLPDELLNLPDRILDAASCSRRLVSITSPEPHKDNVTLVRMLANLVRKTPQEDWHLDIAGGVDAAAWKPIRRLAEDLGVGSRIRWHGFCDQNAITRILTGALCLVAASQLESFAMVALEAMARGCPPVVADCAAMPESIGDAGLLVRPGLPKSFAESVRQIAAEPELRNRLVRCGLERVQQFRWSNCGRDFAAIIERLKFEANGSDSQRVSTAGQGMSGTDRDAA
jgi:glycosyltransferase involved in cell wall biosynthesis